MDLMEIYNFLFNTMPGIGCLVGAGLVISLIAAVILEHRTRKIYKHREKGPDDWSLFDDDDEDEEEAGK